MAYSRCKTHRLLYLSEQEVHAGERQKLAQANVQCAGVGAKTRSGKEADLIAMLK